MRLEVQGRSPEIDRRLEETEVKLINTRQFLDQIAESQKDNRDRVQGLLEELEWQKKRLLGLKHKQEIAGTWHDDSPEE